MTAKKPKPKTVKTPKSTKSKTAKSKARKKPGPKKKTVTLTSMEELSVLQCTYDEAAAFFKMSRTTFIARLDEDPKLREAWQAGKDRGLISLRRIQFKLAKRNAGMAIFLGKQYLGQRDYQSIDASVDARIAVTTMSKEDVVDGIMEKLVRHVVPPGPDGGS